jgi:hypothetical protein
VTLYQLLVELQPAYDKGEFTRLHDYLRPDGALVEPPPSGDTLALFVARELRDVTLDGEPVPVPPAPARDLTRDEALEIETALQTAALQLMRLSSKVARLRRLGSFGKEDT